jgi:hypothetical protein
MPICFENESIRTALERRVLLLNCVNENYKTLWDEFYLEELGEDDWGKIDNRLSSYTKRSKSWDINSPLRNWYERRQALIEIDVLSAIGLGLTLNELILLYNVQFPVLQENEEDTWYDVNGNIVFTCNKGLTGVGVDSGIWKKVRDFKKGEIYEHTIDKSELYKGLKIILHAPFEKCNRIEDYKIAWKYFEEVFK